MLTADVIRSAPHAGFLCERLAMLFELLAIGEAIDMCEQRCGPNAHLEEVRASHAALCVRVFAQVRELLATETIH